MLVDKFIVELGSLVIYNFTDLGQLLIEVPFGWDFFQLAIGPVEAELSLQDEGNIGHVMFMQHCLLVRGKLEDNINNAVLLVDVVDIEGDVLEPVDCAPGDVQPLRTSAAARADSTGIQGAVRGGCG